MKTLAGTILAAVILVLIYFMPPWLVVSASLILVGLAIYETEKTNE